MTPTTEFMIGDTVKVVSGRSLTAIFYHVGFISQPLHESAEYILHLSCLFSIYKKKQAL